ncbi:DMT family transporter [Vibrio misgurnus]|uniref:DMT family transporter n=1 Tax=Vibrio misgurnus TaxID=2993714 RepID=UPI0023F9E39B|nr:DMT family transporter [Vibrio sp. VCS]
MGYEWLALAAAALWALTSLLSITPAKHLGPFAYSRWRMGCTSIILIIFAIFSGGWPTVTHEAIPAMMLSGLIGIFIGDTALFACLNRMGPRQSGLLFSCHAVFSALLGYFLFSESMTGQELLGSSLVFAGVLLAIFFGRRQQAAATHLDNVNGPLWIGISLGLIAALCQALGGIIAKPVMQTAIDPIAASAIRMITAFAAHTVLYLTGVSIARPSQPITFSIFLITALNGLMAMAIGMTLILYALREGNVGMVALLSSTTPIMLLPLLWWYSKQRPNRYAWLGAIIAVAGTGLLVT